MCDTLCALPAWSLSGETIFAKNSDRSPNEPHLVQHVPAADYPAGSMLRCSYIEIPQVTHTRAMILCQPSWIWGAEMGINDAGVVIGNEAVFTKEKRGSAALTGMDLLRLALERAGGARQAVEIIIDLLQQYGQGGNCGYDHEFHYHNSFLASDAQEAYVLETAGTRYAVTRVQQKQAISNRLSIHGEHVMRGGIEETTDFAKQYTEPLYSHFSAARQRRAQSLLALEQKADVRSMMAALRGHAIADNAVFSKGSVSSVCMHAGGLVGDHTTGSLVAVIRKGKPFTLWITGASTPCIAAFKPVFWGAEFVEKQSPPVFSDPKDSLAYWLKRERLHRAILAKQIDFTALRGEIHALEEEWLHRESTLMMQDAPNREALAALSREAAQQEEALIERYAPKSWEKLPGHGRFERYWNQKTTVIADSATPKDNWS